MSTESSDQALLPVTGQCLCGSVSFTVHGQLRDVLDCHCHRCRRWTGHHMAATSTDPANIVFSTNIAFSANDTVTWFSPEQTVEYGFCSTCGSSLFWRVVGRDNHISICAGVLDAPTGLKTAEAWWLSEAGDYFEPSAGVAIRHDTE